MPGRILPISFTIAAAGTTSDTQVTNSCFIDGLIFPATWTAANVTIQVSRDGTTWYDLYDIDGAQVVLTAIAGKAMMLPSAMLRSWDYTRLVSTVAQAATVAVLANARQFN